MNKPVPIAQLDRRLTEQGRIRVGALIPTKSGGTRPSSIDTFRFTSHDRQAIANIATTYGGTVTESNVGRDQWEVTTEASEIDVVLLNDAFTQAYELWSGSGCQRRCDGATVKTPQQDGPDDYSWAESPCICIAKDQMECKLKTRLTVMLPAVRFGGGWRLETSSVNAAMELREMVSNIQALASTGLTRAKLALEQRQSKGARGTKNFTVPVLRVDHSLDQMLDGAAALRAPQERPAIESPITDPSKFKTIEASTAPVVEEPEVVEVEEGEAPASTTDDITDAEVVDDDHDPRTNARFHAIIKDMGLDYDKFVRPYLVARFGKSWSKMTEAEREKVVDPLVNGWNGRSSEDMRVVFAKKVREVA